MFSYALKSGGNLRGIFISIDKRTDCCQRKFLHLLSAFAHFLSPFHLACLCLFLLSSFFVFSICISIRWAHHGELGGQFFMEGLKAVHERAQSHRLGNWDFSSFSPVPLHFRVLTGRLAYWPLLIKRPRINLKIKLIREDFSRHQCVWGNLTEKNWRSISFYSCFIDSLEENYFFQMNLHSSRHQLQLLLRKTVVCHWIFLPQPL